MATSDELLIKLIETLAAEGLDRARLDNMEARCVEWIGQMRAKRTRDIEDVEIAQLIPRGVDVVIERKGGSRRNNFRRASRGRALLKASATVALWDGTIP